MSLAAVNFNLLLTIHTANSAHLNGVMSGGEGAAKMSINDLPVLSALRTKMQWHQERQRVLAENVSHANTPNFRPSDLVEPKFDNKGENVGGAMGSLGMMRTSATHISVSGGGQSFRGDGGRSGFLTKPAGNS